MKTAKSRINEDLAGVGISTPTGRSEARQGVCNLCNTHPRGTLNRIRSFFGPVWVPLANEAPPAHDFEVIGLGNEISAIDEDGWAKVPFGDHPYDTGGQKGLQRFDKAAAEEMVGYFKNVWNRLKRAISGLSVFRGHPDHPAFANVHKDKTTYGTVADMKVGDDGLYIRPILTPEGVALVNSGLKYFSPHWLAKTVGGPADRPIFSPVFLKSIGLTDRPNIGGTSLVNSKPTMNKAHIIALLAALGRNVAADATDEQINQELVAATPLANSLLKRPEQTALANEQGKVTALTGERDEAKRKQTEAETALANEQTAHKSTIKARNEALVDGAIRAGRIVEANKAVWLGRLERDFATESVALANEQGALKTQARTAHLGARGEPNEARDKFVALVNEAMPKHGNDWSASWAAVKATKEGKALHAQMDAAGKATATA